MTRDNERIMRIIERVTGIARAANCRQISIQQIFRNPLQTGSVFRAVSRARAIHF